MSEARAFARRVSLLPLLLFALVEVGCAPAPHAVRLRTADGQVRVTAPGPRPPMVLPKEEAHRIIRALANWAKITSRSYPIGDGTSIQTHAYRNVATGQTVEIKSKLEWVKP